jgi:hypothetical protein
MKKEIKLPGFMAENLAGKIAGHFSAKSIPAFSDSESKNKIGLQMRIGAATPGSHCSIIYNYGSSPYNWDSGTYDESGRCCIRGGTVCIPCDASSVLCTPWKTKTPSALTTKPLFQ